MDEEKKCKIDKFFLYFFMILCAVQATITFYLAFSYDQALSEGDYTWVGHVFVNQTVLDELQKLSYNNNEQGLCLIGQNNTVTNYYYSQSESTPSSIVFKCEKEGTIGKAHSHPAGSCRPSWSDLKTSWLQNVKYEVIVCGDDQPFFFMHEHYWKPLLIVPVGGGGESA